MSQFIEKEAIFVGTLLNSLHVDDVNARARNVSNENYILGLQWDKFDEKILFDISKICEK